MSPGHLRLVAMSRRHHPLVIDEGATTEVVASVQGHLVGDGVLPAGVAPDDLVIVVSGESNLSGERREKPTWRDVQGGARSTVAGSGQLGFLHKHSGGGQ